MKNILSKIFSCKRDERHIVYRFFGIKITRKNPELTRKSIEIQNLYDLSELKNAKKIIVFLIPEMKKINGGIQSVFSICKYSREICQGSLSLISTIPGKYTYAENNLFKNNEKIYRWEQIVKNAQNPESIIIHIPEYYSGNFFKSLSNDDVNFLKSIKDLQINILNQNIEFMPEPAEIKNLYNLTSNITQTIAHKRYATQEICEKWKIPTHLLSVHIDLSGYTSCGFEKKEKIIVISPDKTPYKKAIIRKLEKALPDFKLITVNKLTFDEYMDLIARAYFVITFGEGMDGYFLQPQQVGSVGFAVYNENFFPDESWKELKNIYKNYEEMEIKLVADIIGLLENRDEYYSTIEGLMSKVNKLYDFEKFKENLKKFYEKEYDFLPN